MNTEIIKAVIVDDEEDARTILKRLVLRLGGIEIVGEAENADLGFAEIMDKNPDLVFLDIQMPEKDGFELVKTLKKFNLKTSIVFVTAHNEYAINAMKVAAFDYMLKPVVFDELKETICRFKDDCKENQNESKVDKLLDLLNKSGKISFNTRSGYIYVAPDDIVYCQADVNYTEIHFNHNRKEVVTINIGKVEEMFDKGNFFRINRSHLINIEYLVKADRKTKSCELLKGEEVFTIPAPPKQIRLLEKILKS